MCTCVINIKTEIRKARKSYVCDACNFLREAMDFIRLGGKLNISELREVIKARQDGWRILKGQLYERQYNAMDGNTYTFRCRPEIGKICDKYELYPEC